MYLKQVFYLLVCCLSLSSCYFNSAGHIINAGSYQAKVSTSDAKPGHTIYNKNGRYYTELSRYRNDSKVITQYNAFENNTTTMDKSYDGKQMCEIPADYALYLTGQSNVSVQPAFLRPVDESDIKANGTSMTIVREGKYKAERFDYRSSALPWLWTAATFDWLCVDLPMTCVENSLMPVVGYLYVVRQLSESESRKPSFARSGVSYHRNEEPSWLESARMREEFNRKWVEHAEQHGLYGFKKPE